MTESSLPPLPVTRNECVSYLANHPETPIVKLVEPYKQYDTKVRELFAQEPDNGVLKDPYVNVVQLFDGHDIKTRARNIAEESQDEKNRYLMPLSNEQRRPNGAPATVKTIKDFRNNFNVFTELALADMDWSNVVVAGSAAVTPLVPVPEKYSGSKRALRQYYHEELAPASDVDLFLYGLTEQEAKEKIKQIETKVRDAILQETTTVRTKHAITIVSQYPTRHVQIVLRIYKSISEILTGFDVDCSCIAYDGQHVWAAPRAVAAFMTQTNHIDLSRRSPSYENRLSKYSHRGFEICWPQLDRSRIDPTIFERSFQRTLGLARLLVLEKLPQSTDRDQYLNMRRKERGRPELNWWRKNMHKMRGNIKNDHEDEVADWVDQEDVSGYHTFTIPYGENFNAKKIEKMLYTKDLLMNAEWNRSKDREVNLHRHPAFFGFTEDIFNDCCGHCPKPVTDEEMEVAEEESKIYVSGNISFMKDDPGRQTIGSFNPITDQDWTEMAYVGNTARLCQAIVDGDLEHVQDWLAQEGADPNQRDYTGRTPLQLAVTCSTHEIVKCLIDRGARLVARIADGRTALHLAAVRGDVAIIKMILERSEQNEAVHEEKEAAKKAERKKLAKKAEDEKDKAEGCGKDESEDSNNDEEDHEDEDWSEADDDSEARPESIATGGFVKVEGNETGETLPDDGDEDEPDIYDVNVVAWDVPCSPLHLAILNGHIEAVKEIVSTFGADVLLPVKLLNDYDKSPRAAILTLVLALALPTEKAHEMAKALLDLHATSNQAELPSGHTAFLYYVNNGPNSTQLLLDHDTAAATAALKHIAVAGQYYNPSIKSTLLTAIYNKDSITTLKLLEQGASAAIDFSDWANAMTTNSKQHTRVHFNDDPDNNLKSFKKNVEQPLIAAIQCEVPEIAIALLDRGADPDTISKKSQEVVLDEYNRRYNKGQSALDLVRAKLKQLKEYDGEKNNNDKPFDMKTEGEYLDGLEPGSYKHWVASTDLANARTAFVEDTKTYEKKLKEFEEMEGLEEKRQAITQAIEAFDNLEQALVRRGAKTFKELHPEIEDPAANNHQSYNYNWSKKTPFEVAFNFQTGELTDKLKDSYLELQVGVGLKECEDMLTFIRFQAAWEGDLGTIKLLTLTPQKENQPPLKIAIRDKDGFSPFSIAVLQDHRDVARAILEISLAQYTPKHKTTQTTRYSMTQQYEEDSEYDSDTSGDDDQPRVYSQIVDDTFTMENIGEVSLTVKSHTTPLDFLEWTCPIHRFADGLKYSNSLIEHAIAEDNVDLLKYLLDLGTYWSTIKSENGITPTGTFYSLKSKSLDDAISYGHTGIISELLKRTGCGIPFEELVKKSGVKIEEKSKYYQGLSVYGKKRTDWAAAGRRTQVQTMSGSSIPPLLTAAKAGTLEALEYLLSDAPLRLYADFAAANKDDKRVKKLSQASGGVEKAVANWYSANEEYLIVCAVLDTPTEDSSRRLQYLIKAYPQYLDVKTTSGETSLQVAFRLGRYSAAQMLLKAGANPTTRDKVANNLIHSLLAAFTPGEEKDGRIKQFRVMLELLDPKICHEMFLQRSSATAGDGGTPLHNWLKSGYLNSGSSITAKLIDLVLQYSQGDDLTMINSIGDTALHTLIAANEFHVTQQLLNFNTDLLYRENATGRTPLELAQDRYTALKFRGPPEIKAYHAQYRHRFGYNNNTSIETIADDPPSDFVAITPKVVDEERIWNLCSELADEHPAKRKLVSLNEANEVARRLGEMAGLSKGRETARARYRNAEDEERRLDEEVETDPVGNWIRNASAWV